MCYEGILSCEEHVSKFFYQRRWGKRCYDLSFCNGLDCVPQIVAEVLDKNVAVLEMGIYRTDQNGITVVTLIHKRKQETDMHRSLSMKTQRRYHVLVKESLGKANWDTWYETLRSRTRKYEVLGHCNPEGWIQSSCCSLHSTGVTFDMGQNK